ncbi:MAG: YitT family protein [Ectothiorhodospiraceae bacterium]|nr:YitT family protein [Ectothiorhodospiraceae bacterium]MCH8503613.1 YitT family protein [Ectothiorhodospiraceae bacterium]
MHRLPSSTARRGRVPRLRTLMFPGERLQRGSLWLAALIEGCLLVAVGLVVIQASGLLISGMAGFALILERATGLSFGLLFVLANAPFYLLALAGLGWRFTAGTIAAVTLLGLLTDLLSASLQLTVSHPAIGAVIGGGLLGFGMVILIRAGASLGGVNILAVFLERRWGIHPGRTVFTADVFIMLGGLAVFSPLAVITSMAAIATLSYVLGRYHRRPAIERHRPR